MGMTSNISYNNVLNIMYYDGHHISYVLNATLLNNTFEDQKIVDSKNVMTIFDYPLNKKSFNF